jgi:hypothetical protein
MSAKAARIHYYHADASALGGTIERPVREHLSVQSSVSLPPVGGFAATRSETFRLHDIVSAKSTHSQVSGSKHPVTGNATTMATTVVEGLNILHVLTADYVVSQISVEHPLNGYDPRVTFFGSQIVNLRIAGHPLEVILDLDIFGHGNHKRFPAGPCVRDAHFLKKIRQKYDEKKGYVRCSLVKDIKDIRDNFPGKREGHMLEIPDFGRVFLGEFLVDSTSHRLIMVRVELGCPTQGDLSASTASVEGRGYP